jgi:hypothetical protein
MLKLYVKNVVFWDVAPLWKPQMLQIICSPSKKIMWHVDPLLDNDLEISNYTTAVAK